MTQQALAVLDDNTASAMVLGWARDEYEARMVAQKAGIERGSLAMGVGIQPARLRFDPDLHTVEDVDQVNADARAWIVSWQDPA